MKSTEFLVSTRRGGRWKWSAGVTAPIQTLRDGALFAAQSLILHKLGSVAPSEC